ncbi:flavin-containing monooxygenase [Patulibacter defluvii]|uniref:flavin-containing monooxygenase n=1 Tax=Patulibacter defluvii TaxID=3095358 RepID=UPI0035C926E6
MSGLCMAATLDRAGIEDVTLFERADRVGGTWRDNTYPGLSCDVPSRFYQFTFAPNPDWSRFFSPGPEIHRYFDEVADRLRLRRRIAFGTELVSARFEDERWRLRTAAGDEHQADFLISCCGILRDPRVPAIPGLDDFAGARFHSARWDHDVPVEGRRVAVIGTGSTGVQIVCGLAGVAGRVSLFQRTPQWILPLPNPGYSRITRALHGRLPLLDRVGYGVTRASFEYFARALTQPGWRRRVVGELCRLNLRSVRDPALRRKLTPDYEPMCKRLVVSSGFYPAVQRDDVELVTDAIERIEPSGIRTRDGRLHEVDVLVLATGFDAHAYMRPMELVGEDGLTIEQAWSDGPRAYRTVSLPGFPNFFMLMGPHSPVGNYSLTAIAETQATYVLRWIDRWRAGRLATVQPTPEATDRFNASMRAAMPGTVWTTGCDSWYLGADGLPELWPWTPDHHRRLLSRIEEADHVTTPVRVPATTGGAA